MQISISVSSKLVPAVSEHQEHWSTQNHKERFVNNMLRETNNSKPIRTLLKIWLSLLLIWFYSLVPALTAPTMLLRPTLSGAMIFHLLTLMPLRSSSAHSSHLFGGRPTRLVPFGLVNVSFLQGFDLFPLKRCPSHLTPLALTSLITSGSPKSW
jgi:hypothetical protein